MARGTFFRRLNGFFENFTGGLIAVLLISASGHAAFREQEWGARASGVGYAFSSLADDSTAVFWNPAGTAFLSRSEMSMMWNRTDPGLEDGQINAGFVSLAIPTRRGAYGLAATIYNAGNLVKENVGLVHYALRLGRPLSVGVNFKFLSHGFNVDSASSSNPVFANGTSRSAFTFDAGLKFQPVSFLSFGVMGRNLTEPDVGFDSPDKVPAEYQAGVAVQLRKRLSMEIDGYYRNQIYGGAREKMDYRAGLENWFIANNRMAAALRFGVNGRQATGGMSVHLHPKDRVSLRVDYAYSFNNSLVQTGGGTHKFGVSVFFSGEEKENLPYRAPRLSNSGSVVPKASRPALPVVNPGAVPKGTRTVPAKIKPAVAPAKGTKSPALKSAPTGKSAPLPALKSKPSAPKRSIAPSVPAIKPAPRPVSPPSRKGVNSPAPARLYLPAERKKSGKTSLIKSQAAPSSVKKSAAPLKKNLPTDPLSPKK